MPTEKKKKSKGGQKLRLWVPYVCLITILSLSYELWKQSYCLPNKLFTMDPTIFELWVMKTENWVIRTNNPNGPREFKDTPIKGGSLGFVLAARPKTVAFGFKVLLFGLLFRPMSSWPRGIWGFQMSFVFRLGLTPESMHRC